MGREILPDFRIGQQEILKIQNNSYSYQPNPSLTPVMSCFSTMGELVN
jgi:hypothetical protein